MGFDLLTVVVHFLDLDIMMMLTIERVSIIYGCRSTTKTFSLSSCVLITMETEDRKDGR